MVYYQTDGLTDVEALELRAKGAEIWSCWFCRHYGLNRANWFAKDCVIAKGEHLVRCPNHREARRK